MLLWGGREDRLRIRAYGGVCWRLRRGFGLWFKGFGRMGRVKDEQWKDSKDR